jgi:glycerol-3-phosphate O-acyltransferase/dihydroxyacetone phosphate acyltransferase
MNLIYFIIRKFGQAIAAIYFKKVHVVGLNNIPKDGPVILCGNHANQFIDPILIASFTGRQLSFTIAASSFTKPVVGDLAKALKAIPVKRPEDSKVKGVGKIVISGSKLTGKGTQFIEQGEKLGKGWSLLISNKTVVVKTVIDNENLEITQSDETNLLNDKELDYYVSKLL